MIVSNRRNQAISRAVAAGVAITVIVIFGIGIAVSFPKYIGLPGGKIIFSTSTTPQISATSVTVQATSNPGSTSTVVPPTNFNSSADYKITFEGSAHGSATYTYSPQSASSYFLVDYTSDWSWNFVFYYVGSGPLTNPVVAGMYINQSTVKFVDTQIFTAPAVSCSATETQINGPLVMSMMVFPNGTAMNSGGTGGYFPWGSVSVPDNGWTSNASLPSGVSICQARDLGEFYSGVHQETDQAVRFPIAQGSYGGFGGTVSGVTCPEDMTTPINCIESPGATVSTAWSGTVSVYPIACNDLPVSMQNC